MSLRFTDWVIEEQERVAMTDDEKARELLKAVRWLDNLSVRGMLWTKRDTVAQNINRPLEDDLISLAARIRDGQEG